MPSILDEFAPITYNYSFFHLIFALASMYIAMLMTGWGSQVRDVGGAQWGISAVPGYVPAGSPNCCPSPSALPLPFTCYTAAPRPCTAALPPHPLSTPPLQAQDQDRIDVGWASVWVKTAAQWVTSILYCWTLIAPALFPGRQDPGSIRTLPGWACRPSLRSAYQ